jgi:hypothetical protein
VFGSKDRDREKRFVAVYKQGGELSDYCVSILVDRETGVNYLYTQSGYSGGLTPLLDADGRAVVTPVETKD